MAAQNLYEATLRAEVVGAKAPSCIFVLHSLFS